MKTFHNIVQGVLSNTLGYGLINGCNNPEESYCSTVYDQLYQYECHKAFKLNTDVWKEISNMAKNGINPSIAITISLRNKLKKEHESNRNTISLMMANYAYYRTRAINYHNTMIKSINLMNRIIETRLELAGF